MLGSPEGENQREKHPLTSDLFCVYCQVCVRPDARQD